MKIDLLHNRIVSETMSDAFKTGVEDVLLPLVLAARPMADGILMYEDYIAESPCRDGKWYYPLSVSEGGVFSTLWVTFPYSGKGSPYATANVPQFEIASDVPAEIAEILIGKSISYNNDSVKISVRTTGNDPLMLVGKYSQTFVDELARQITSRLSRAMEVSGLGASSIELELVFAPGTYMEHTSENVTYRRLLLVDKSSQPRDFWVKWSPRGTDAAYTVSDNVTSEDIIFELGEDVAQKIREKEYRFLCSSNPSKYQSAMGKKTVTEWREIVKRAIRRGELTKTVFDLEVPLRDAEINESLTRVLGMLGDTPATPEEKPMDEPIQNDFDNLGELLRAALDAAPQEREEVAVPAVGPIFSLHEVDEEMEDMIDEDIPPFDMDSEIEPEIAEESDTIPQFSEFGIDEITEEELYIETEENMPDEFDAPEEVIPEEDLTHELELLDGISEEPEIEVALYDEDTLAEVNFDDEEINFTEEEIPEVEEVPMEDVEEELFGTEEEGTDEYDGFFTSENEEKPVTETIDDLLREVMSEDAEETAEEEDARDFSDLPEFEEDEENIDAEEIDISTLIDERALREVKPSVNVICDTKGSEEESYLIRELREANKLAESRIMAEEEARRNAQLEADNAKCENEELRRENDTLLEKLKVLEDNFGKLLDDYRLVCERVRVTEEKLRREIEIREREESRERDMVTEAARVSVEEQRRIEESVRINEHHEENYNFSQSTVEETPAYTPVPPVTPAPKPASAMPEAYATAPFHNPSSLASITGEIESVTESVVEEVVIPEVEYMSKRVKIIFKQPTDFGIMSRIKGIIEDTVIAEGKENVPISMRATTEDADVVVLYITKMPASEYDLLIAIVKAIGNARIGVTKIILE